MDSVYFTFADGALGYRCAGCGACCKGLGIGIDAAGGQLVQLLARRPGLAAFVRRRGEATTAFNPRDRCWFLDDGGLCRIEVEDGRAAKPASCRLFPFNRVFRAGRFTIVDFNSVICPLFLVEEARQGDAPSVVSRHADLLAEIATVKDQAIIGSPLPAEDAVILREQQVAAKLFAARTLDEAWAAQASGKRPGLDEPLRALIGLGFAAPSEITLRRAIALTPSMRFNELFGPRQVGARAALVPLLPRMWLGWIAFAAVGEELAARPLDLQQLTTLWSEQAPLLHVLSRWNERPRLPPGSPALASLPTGDTDDGVRELARALADAKARRTLGEIVHATLGAAPPHARVSALKLADPILRAAFA